MSRTCPARVARCRKTAVSQADPMEPVPRPRVSLNTGLRDRGEPALYRDLAAVCGETRDRAGPVKWNDSRRVRRLIPSSA